MKDSMMKVPMNLMDKAIFENQTYLAPSVFTAVVGERAALEQKVGTVHTNMESLKESFTALRFVLAFYCFVLMLKFFKGFRANPRLSVVTDTMIAASIDFAHFVVVFFTIFVSFCVCGTLFFGHRLREFSTFW